MTERDLELEDQCWEDFGEGESYLNHEKFAALIRSDEREACAKVCDEVAESRGDADECATEIRARGNA